MKTIARERRDRTLLAWQIGRSVGFSKGADLDKWLAAFEPKAAKPPAPQLPPEELMARMDLWRVALTRQSPAQPQT